MSNPLASDDRFLTEAMAEAKAIFAADGIICIPIYRDSDGGNLTAPVLFDGIDQEGVTKLLQSALKQGSKCALCCTESNH